MPCAIPPVDQSVAQLGWGKGLFLGPRGAGVRPLDHGGQDFLADVGSPVVVPWGGTVVAKGHVPFGGAGDGFSRDALGHYVTISHGPLWRHSDTVYGPSVWTRYATLREASPLEIGQSVRQGDLLGYVGTSGLAPENRDRPRLFMQAFSYEPSERAPSTDPITRFFNPLGVVSEGSQTPGPAFSPYEQTPAWGGRLVLDDACTTSTSGLRGLDPRMQQPTYQRYGRTSLSSRAPYAPAVYAGSVGNSGSGLVVVLGIGFGAWWLLKPGRRAFGQRKVPPWWVRRKRWK